MPSILIAEDNEDLRKMLAWLLQPHGYDILEAATALKRSKRRVPRTHTLGYSPTRHERGGRCAGNKERSTHCTMASPQGTPTLKIENDHAMTVGR
jgi:hypothetical protein